MACLKATYHRLAIQYGTHANPKHAHKIGPVSASLMGFFDGLVQPSRLLASVAGLKPQAKQPLPS